MANGAQRARARTLAYKCAIYSVLLFFVAVLQVSFFGRINLLGATPDLLLAAVLTLSMYEEHKASTICGIIAGFFYCALGGFSYPLYLVFSFLCGYIFWGISEHVFGKNYPSYLAFAALAFGVKSIYIIVEASLSAQSFHLIGTVAYKVIPAFLSSMLFCSVSYFIFAGLAKILNKKSKSRKDHTI